ncbi:MAG TPA: DUF6445 family protein [Steroidobacteraceae bacterium]|nr:DUF6445 family protein [Steroidobacteraceae bacterium]
MRPELKRFGAGQNPVVVVDGFSGAVDDIVNLAAALAPFPAIEGNYYPGLRRVITGADGPANAYVEQSCERLAPFIGGAFDVDGFDLIEASFSMVTTAPSTLTPPQQAPHFDSTDPKHYAVLHYLNVPNGSGTAFYRQRSTGIERVTEANAATFVETAQAEAAELPANSGYIHGSDRFFEQIGAVEAVPDRLIVYRGSLLHSGIIPPGMDFSADPRAGRLTANIFVRGH